MDTIKITLETLYDILRNEKKRDDLQKLEHSFYIDVVSYVREKKALLASQQDDDNVFAHTEKEKLEYELRSITRILKEIYEKREKKIIDIALNKSRTGSDIIDTSAMLREEKEFYDSILGSLDIYRKGILLHLFKGELPNVLDKRVDIPVHHEALKVEEKPQIQQPTVENSGLESEPSKEQPQTKEPESVEESSDDLTKIRFIHPMPSFVWKDMKVYGPYDVGEEIDIFAEVADLLIKKKRAEKI